LNSDYGFEIPPVSVPTPGKKSECLTKSKLKDNKSSQRMAEPKLNPGSAGVPKVPPPGKWVYPACTNLNAATELYCSHCSKTPSRSAKVGLLDPVVATELASSFKFVDDNDNLDPTFQKHDHNKVFELKEISEFGHFGGKDDTKLLNSRLHSKWRKLDGRPTKDEMWSTQIFCPQDFELDLDSG
jgi:hypothetical protein